MRNIANDCGCFSPVFTNRESIICCKCLSILTDLEIDDVNYEIGTKSNLRFKKFQTMLNKKKIDNLCKMQLLDLYKVLESYFMTGTKVNFLNMSELTRCMLIKINFPEYINLFTPIKNRERAEAVRQFVEDAITYGYGKPKILQKHPELFMMSIGEFEIFDEDKYFANTKHIYSDL